MSFSILKKDKKNVLIDFKKKIFLKIEEPIFKDKLEKVINEVDYFKAKISDNELIYKRTGSTEEIIKISISEKNVRYSKQNSTTIITGIYHWEPSGKRYIKYSTKQTTIYKNVFKGKQNNLYDVYNITEEISFSTFDENLKEIWYLNENKDETYYQNKKTKEKVLADPDCFENYTEKDYYFREEPNFIIHRVIRKYQHPEDGNEIRNEDSCLIAKNYQPDNKRISRGGYYFGIPKEIYSGYKLGKNTQDDMWNSKVKVRNVITYF